MKKQTKYIALAVIVILSIFIISTRSEASEYEVISGNKVNESKGELAHTLLEYYNKTETQQVSYKLDSLLHRINKSHDFNGSLLVAKNGKIVYNNQIGYADFNKKVPLNEVFTFQLASVSKQFTATAIMLLYERDQIRLNDYVNTYFPDFPFENVTIKNLLNHTAGLPKYFWVTDHKWKNEKAPTNSEMMTFLESINVQRHFAPGSRFDYSNTGYFVLASIVEKVSGMSFGDFMKENIFDPLEMKDSFVYSFENDSIKSNQLEGYRLYKGWRHLKINSTLNDAIVGDKNVYSTCEDLFKWTLGLNNGKILSKESLDLMYTEGETIKGRKIPYGFGFRIDNQEQNIIYHHGKWNGFSTALTQYPGDDLVIIILEHTSYKGLAALNKNVKKIVDENFRS